MPMSGLDAKTYIKAINATQLTYKGKPEILYVGAEFCPYCAASRWAMILALMRFGNFTGLKYSESSATDVYSDTPTFTFVNSTYSSRYLSFLSFETETRVAGTPLQVMDQISQGIYNKYGDAIPFLDFGNKYVQSGSMSKPSGLCGTKLDYYNITAPTGQHHRITRGHWSYKHLHGRDMRGDKQHRSCVLHELRKACRKQVPSLILPRNKATFPRVLCRSRGRRL